MLSSMNANVLLCYHACHVDFRQKTTFTGMMCRQHTSCRWSAVQYYHLGRVYFLLLPALWWQSSQLFCHALRPWYGATRSGVNVDRPPGSNQYRTWQAASGSTWSRANLRLTPLPSCSWDEQLSLQSANGEFVRELDVIFQTWAELRRFSISSFVSTTGAFERSWFKRRSLLTTSGGRQH